MQLSTLHKSLSREEREILAKAAGTNAGYLWQLATQWRGKKPSLEMIQALAAADSRLTLADLVAEFTGERDGRLREPVDGGINA
jgi:hypothetical protein